MSIFGDYVAVVKLTLNDEYYQMLKEMAEAKNKSIQDYIRDKIFNLSTIFTPEEAIKRIQNRNFESIKSNNSENLPGKIEEEVS